MSVSCFDLGEYALRVFICFCLSHCELQFGLTFFLFLPNLVLLSKTIGLIVIDTRPNWYWFSLYFQCSWTASRKSIGYEFVKFSRPQCQIWSFISRSKIDGSQLVSFNIKRAQFLNRPAQLLSHYRWHWNRHWDWHWDRYWDRHLDSH